MIGIQEKKSFEVKEFNEETRIVEGWASVFNNLDSDNDRILPGSYAKSIKEWGPEGKNRIKLCMQHNMQRPIGKILEMKEDSKGLYIRAQFGTDTDGENYYRMTKEEIITEFSVGFFAQEKKENEDGGYDISSIKLYEVSMVTVAANDEALVTNVKSNNVLKLVKQVGDDKLQFKLEYEFLKLMKDAQETTTKTETEDTPEVSSSQDVVAEPSIMDELSKLY